YDGILMSDFIGDAIESREASCYSLDICELTSIKSIYEYAQKLIENENYNEAITKLKFILFVDKEHEFSFIVNKLIGECYAHLKSFTFTEKFFLDALRHSRNLREVIEVKFELLKVYLRDRNTEKAEIVLNELTNRRDMNQFKDEINYWSGWVHLYKGQYIKAKEKFNSIVDSSFVTHSKLLSDICDSILAEQKSEFKAVLLSAIVPGTGQIYSGEFLSGLISFGWNALWTYLTLDAVTSERYFDASIIGSLLWYRFYSGNIQNAQSSIENFNTKVSNNWLNYLQNNFKGPKP
ncbi:MAG: hypothetical protein N3A61_05285, partial [Ignavibacteria bacterium]|nr:hypothetical protein [Ignavibacteria bacterium]